MTILNAARQVKHSAFVLRKRSRAAWKRWKFEVATVAFAHSPSIRSWTYRADRYADTFLATTIPASPAVDVPRRVFAIWAGDNELTFNRRRNLDALRSQLGVPIELVTPSSLERWIVPDHPLHEAYADLSLIHRSDYLRGYLMHHHGGGYVDIKRPMGPWISAFDMFSTDRDAWVLGYTTTHANWIGKLRGRIGLDILINYRLMFGKGAFVMRANSPLTAEWMAQMDAILDASQEELRQHPGDAFGASVHYPLSWTDLLGRVLDPLTLKYHEHVRFDDALLLEFRDYR